MLVPIIAMFYYSPVSGHVAAQPQNLVGSVFLLCGSKSKVISVKCDHVRLRMSIFRRLLPHLESESFWGDERGVCLEEELVVETCDTCDGQKKGGVRGRGQRAGGGSFDVASCKITRRPNKATHFRLEVLRLCAGSVAALHLSLLLLLAAHRRGPAV